ncbi:MAG: very short patch repair endonuclease [Planctomycetota bacterium]|nr:MAG: very short patch repair endonuclease [Planctomycetota bacterium]
MDVHSPTTRSYLMSRVRSRDTGPEVCVRRVLHGLGFRYRLQRSPLPGSPDIVLTRYRTVVFVHGCFWHRHQKCNKSTMPATNRAFWQAKFAANVARDRRDYRRLRRLGWKVVIVWECELRNYERLRARLDARIRN